MKFLPIYAKGLSPTLVEDVDLAEANTRHTMVADPLADRTIEELADSVGSGKLHYVIRRAPGHFEDPLLGPDDGIHRGGFLHADQQSLLCRSRILDNGVW